MQFAPVLVIPTLTHENIHRLPLLALSLTVPALAETLKFPADKPFASIAFRKVGRPLWRENDTANNEDETCSSTSSSRDPDIARPFERQSVRLAESKTRIRFYKDSKSTLNGMNVVTVTVDAKSDSGPMKLTLTSVEVTKDQGVMVILRGEGVADNKEEITAILNSIAAVK